MTLHDPQANTSLPSPPGDHVKGTAGYYGDISYHGDILLSHNSSHDTHYHGDDETDCGYKQSKEDTTTNNCTLTSVQTVSSEASAKSAAAIQHSQHKPHQQQHPSPQPTQHYTQQQQHKQSAKQLIGRSSLEGTDHISRTKRQQSNDSNKSTGGGVVGSVKSRLHVNRRKQHFGAYRSQSGSNLHHHDNSSATVTAQRLPVVKSCSGEYSLWV